MEIKLSGATVPHFDGNGVLLGCCGVEEPIDVEVLKPGVKPLYELSVTLPPL